MELEQKELQAAYIGEFREALIDYLLVGGGGAGGRGRKWAGGGGGGGGGVVYGGCSRLRVGAYSVVVGAGGVGSTANYSAACGKGEDSCFDNNVAYGGGAGGCYRKNGCNATTYGSGGGAGGYNASAGCFNCGGNGCQGVFIARYPAICPYNITGGTKYSCNGYCIHCFTSNGTLTIN